MRISLSFFFLALLGAFILSSPLAGCGGGDDDDSVHGDDDDTGSGDDDSIGDDDTGSGDDDSIGFSDVTVTVTAGHWVRDDPADAETLRWEGSDFELFFGGESVSSGARDTSFEVVVPGDGFARELSVVDGDLLQMSYYLSVVGEGEVLLKIYVSDNSAVLYGVPDGFDHTPSYQGISGYFSRILGVHEVSVELSQDFSGYWACESEWPELAWHGELEYCGGGEKICGFAEYGGHFYVRGGELRSLLPDTPPDPDPDSDEGMFGWISSDGETINAYRRFVFSWGEEELSPFTCHRQ